MLRPLLISLLYASAAVIALVSLKTEARNPVLDPVAGYEVDGSKLVLTELTPEVSSHECDTILVGDADDPCPEVPGCTMSQTKTAIRHKIFGSTTFFCDGTASNTPRVGFTNTFHKPTVGGSDVGWPGHKLFFYHYTGDKVSRRSQAAYNPMGGATMSTSAKGMPSYEYIIFSKYHDGRIGLLSRDCNRDISGDVDEASKGHTQGSTYIYKTSRGGDPNACTRKSGLKNYEALCGDLSMDKCILRFQPVIKYAAKYDDYVGPWTDAIEPCPTATIPLRIWMLSETMGVVQDKGLLGCRFPNAMTRREIHITVVAHDYWTTVLERFVRFVFSLIWSLVKPLFEALYDTIKWVAWLPIMLVLDNTYATAAVIILVPTVMFYAYRRIRKLTDPVINVRVLKDL